MPWVRNEMKRNETEWNGTERRQAAQHLSMQPAVCTIVCTCSTYSLFIFSYTLSISLTLLLLRFSWAALLCLWEATAAICERGLCPQKKGKQVTNKKRAKNKKNIVARKLHNRPRPKGRPWRGREAWHVDFVLCAVFSANVRSFLPTVCWLLRHILLFSRLGL